jgi:hypothetical protein
MASKDKEVESTGILSRVPGGALLFAVLPLTILSYLGWYHFVAERVDEALYSLSVENIKLSEPPPWVAGDLVKDVYDTTALNRISLLDPDASPMIARAFETHRWIHSTTRVSKSYNEGVEVEVVYRKPLAMLIVSTETVQPPATLEEFQSSDSQNLGMFPLDKEGVILPQIAPELVDDFFYVIAPGAQVTSQEGLPCNDPSIVAALSLCSTLESFREKLGLKSVVVARDFNSTSQEPWLLTLNTQDNRQIMWGHPPGYELSGEPSVQDKLTRLSAWLESSSSVASSIDLTRLSPLPTVSTTSPLSSSPSRHQPQPRQF